MCPPPHLHHVTGNHSGHASTSSKRSRAHQQQLLTFPYENMQNGNSDCNGKIKEMDGGHRL